MSAIIISDLHQTDKPQDEYRWGIFDFVREKAEELSVDHVLCLGDITDAKGFHSAELVNRLVESIDPGWIFLKGNHDYISPDLPFFKFIKNVGVHFINKPTFKKLTIAGTKSRCLFLPSTRNWQEEWDGLDFSDVDYIFAHATFTGAAAENGQAMTGIPTSVFSDFDGRVLSGDIHVPQKIGKIEYIGAPYHIRFGDSFNPRCLYIDKKGESHNLIYPCLRKFVLKVDSELEFISDTETPKEGDQIKFEVHLKRSEFPEWPDIKKKINQVAKKKGWSLFGVKPVITQEIIKTKIKTIYGEKLTPRLIVEQFSDKNQLSEDLTKIGLKLVQ